MARDIFHQVVREALEADGWLITHDPLILKLGGLRLEIDLAAEQVLAAERGSEHIAVEVKSFLSKSKLSDFYQAKGQYDVYLIGLQEDRPSRKLFLAVDTDIYTSFFQKPLIQKIVADYSISLLVFDANSKRIVQWIAR
ncbi:element excision factor XisH family protein [Spirosoma montaniterrae]|uniref:Fatty-acid oxidation protein subunit alpha n=1 Tax=Spirosoma montaniterrae TaxID=1178516 RepID=A0A1P9X3F8_9BACT|nr:element excision factor XisH family protein [Spirosoma montaniterrae]AQG82162.1 fatty-acid oxidation protein subunit alpha [Spirosoma montaniterrae]